MKAGRVVVLIAGLQPICAAADETCQAQVETHKFTAQEARTFMENCKQVAIMVCEGRVVDKKVADDAKDSFLKTCVRDEMGR